MTELPSVTVTCTLNGLPALVVGVPVITPLPLPRLNPPGKPVCDHVYVPVPPVAVTVAEYAEFTVPTANVDGPDIDSGARMAMVPADPMDNGTLVSPSAAVAPVMVTA